MGDIAIPFTLHGSDLFVTNEKQNQIKYFAKLSYDPDPYVVAARLRVLLKNAGILATVEVKGDKLIVSYDESVVEI